MSNKIRRQRPVKGGRQAIGACVLPEMKREIERLARKYNVSKSFVTASIYADTFGISKKDQERIEDVDRPKLRRVK